MSMQPLPKALIEALAGQFPALYSQEHKEDPLVLAHFYSPATGWEWHLWEGSPVDENGYYDTKHEKVDFLCFGLVCGFEDEVGYVSLSELLSVAGKVERDLAWQPKKRSEVQAEREQYRNAPPSELVRQTVKAEAEPPTFDAFLMQHQRIAREQALAWAEKVGWNIVAGMVLGPDLATVWVDELNEARRQRVLPVLDAEQEAEYRQVFVRTLKDKRPSPEPDAGSSPAFTVEGISLDDLTDADLCRIRDLKLRRDLRAYRLTAPERTSTGEALSITGLRRLGITWDGVASWANVPDVQTGVRWWLKEPGTWRRHTH